MTYIPDESKAVYRAMDGKDKKTFDPLEWLAALCSPAPNSFLTHKARIPYTSAHWEQVYHLTQED